MTRGSINAAVLLACGACGGAAAPDSLPLTGVQALAADAGPQPRWVQRRCESGLWQARRVICAVGSVTGYNDASLAISAAEAHARAELAGDLSTRVAKHFEEAAGRTTSLVDGEVVEQKDAKVDLETIVDRSISGVRSEQVWVSTSGAVYALVMVDEDKFEAELARAVLVPAAPPSPSAARASSNTKPTKVSKPAGSLDYP